MSQVAIHVENVGKLYRIGERQRYKALRDTLSNALYAPFRAAASLFNGPHTNASNDDGDSHFWSLKDVSFDIKQGDAVGIIGRNGAGKSTLLKILSRITKPTEGYVKIHGRVGSLLEVGTGFHPELTGRENVYLNGAIIGMRKKEINCKFNEIVDFAEVEKFIDTPVKLYSSGMYVRLAFAVAAHMEPEILLVDEVLAVGDAAFQRKCLGKMGDVAKEGRTVLFVSHNMTAVQSLCTEAICLERGRVAKRGVVSSVINSYLQTTASSRAEQVWPDLETAAGNDRVRLHSVRVLPQGEISSDQLTIVDPFAIEIQYWNLKSDARLNLSLSVYNQEGVCVFVSTTEFEPKWHGRRFPRGLFRSVCQIPGDLLNDGMHRVTLLVVQDSGLLLYRHDDVLTFELHDSPDRRRSWYGKWQGAVRVNLKWTTQHVCASKEGTAGASFC